MAAFCEQLVEFIIVGHEGADIEFGSMVDDMKDQCDLKNHLTFKSDLPDLGEWDADGLVIRPPGFEHSQLLNSRLRELGLKVGEPWNEEDYAWEFLCWPDKIRSSVLIGLPDETEWLVVVISVTLFPFFRRRKIKAAQQAVADMIERALKSDARFREVRRYTESEYR